MSSLISDTTVSLPAPGLCPFITEYAGFRVSGSPPGAHFGLPSGSYEFPRGFGLMLSVDDPGETERLFSALAENGTVRMPLQETFWAHRFGVLTDQFGISWDINYEKSE